MSIVLRVFYAGGSATATQTSLVDAVADACQGKIELGKYIRDYDPNAHQGRGKVLFTDDIAKAKTFPDKSAAWEFWRQQSKVRPLRDDGEPNRPLTAYNVTFEDNP